MDQDRIVLVCPNRAQYPDDAVELLSTHPNIVPWGVVTDSWHTGSRRSGQGPVTHWQQPWFRWWDSWAGWFFPETSRPGSANPSSFSPVIAPVDYALPTGVSEVKECSWIVGILGGCPQTTDMYRQQAAHAGWRSSVFRSPAELLDCQPLPDVILWDDSWLGCLPHHDYSEAAQNFLGQLTNVIPPSRVIASLDLEHLYLWPGLRKRGCSDMFVKPSPALALCNCLTFQATHVLPTGGMTTSASDG